MSVLSNSTQAQAGVRAIGREVRRLIEDAGVDAFRYGKSQGKEAAPAHQDCGIAALLARNRAATGADMTAIAWEVSALKLSIRRDDKIDPRVDKLWVFTMDVNGIPRDAYISQKNSALWVNVAGLESGSGGDAVYQVAGAYAHNHKLKFIGDPDGITEAGKRRRLEAISALSLKYGTTGFIEPHQDMIGWNGLQWIGNDDDKLGLVARTSCLLTQKLYPGVKHVGFTGFEFTYEGRRISTIALDRLVQQWRGALARPQREGAPGSGTVRMAALYASLDSQPDDQGGPGLRLGAGEADAAALRACLSSIRA